MTYSSRTGIYFHWPFCASKCPYCDFNVHVSDAVDHDRWLDAYLRSIEHYAQLLPNRRIDTVFFGGGTPSLMKPSMVEAILEKIRACFPMGNNPEVTLEANPTSVELNKFADFAAAGINRVSIGVQSLNDKDLAFLGRTHSAAEARKAIETARHVFGRFSFDLIYARPNQSRDAWRTELKSALEIAGDHLSLYQLTIERSTPFYFAREQGKFVMPAEDLAADFYNETQDIMGAAGLPAYEVSNHARGDHDRSAHNMIYWHYDDYIGIGPGAHGRLTMDGVKHATRDHHAPEKWLEWVQSKGHGAYPFEAIPRESQCTEALMMGLRLHEGMAPTPDIEAALDPARIKLAREEGWLTYESGKLLCLTREGMLRLNALIPFLLR